MPPPPDLSETNSDIISLGTLATRSKDTGGQQVGNPLDTPLTPELKEGTPEDIRRNFFPSEAPPEDNPALAWMLDNPKGQDRVTSEFTPFLEPRYSLSGARLIPSEIRDLPTHLGLHHHSSKSSISDNPAGYTLADLLLLSRSSVPAQRASILGVLSKILKVACEERFYATTSPNILNPDDLDDMRRNILDAAINALSEKGGVGLRAMDALWGTIVGFTHAELQITSIKQLPCVEFFPISKNASVREPSALSSHGLRMLSLQSLAFLTSLPLKSIIPTIQTHLLDSPPLSLVHSHVLDILFLLAHSHVHAQGIVDASSNGGIISAMLIPHLQSPSTSDSNGKPNGMVKSIFVLQQLALCGRDIAAALLGPADIILRYIVTPLPRFQTSGELQQDTLSLALLQETITFFSFLARYGLYAHVATTAQSEFGNIAEWLLVMVRQNCPSEIIIFATRYLEFLETLIVCAHDPHKTTPAHEILWSQIEGWGWMDWIFDLAEAVSTSLYLQTGPDLPFLQNFWASLLHCLAAWLAGASINGVKGGEEERARMAEGCCALFVGNHGAMLALRTALTITGISPSDAVTSEVLSTLSQNAYLLLGVVRLGLPYLNSQIPHPLELAVHHVQLYCARLLEEKVVQRILHLSNTLHLKEDALVSLRSISSLLAINLQFLMKDLVDIETRKTSILTAAHILSSLLPGDECLARRLLQSVCDFTDTELVQTLGPNFELKDTGGLHILLPFYLDSLSLGTSNANSQSLLSPLRFIGPLFPSSDTISNCSTLLMPSFSSWYQKWHAHEPDFILPLKNDWPTWPINHLLRSGSSQVFRNPPSSWDASETDVVNLSLLLVRVIQVLAYQNGKQSFEVSISRPEAIFACMKVFMLEHGQNQIDSGMDVFRDPAVGQNMEDLLAHFSYAKLRHMPTVMQNGTLEDVSRTFLGSQTSFYQFYTDFVALYDAISFFHSLFGRLLIPPLSMLYPLDYRKLLFGDFNHVLRTIKSTPEEIYTEDVREYLWPVEHDRTMIGWYFKTIITPRVEGFFRWMSVHHFASNIWPDLERECLALGQAKKLLKALVTKGSRRDIKDVVLYNQSQDCVLLPPECYEGKKREVRETRLQYIQTLEDPDLEGQLRGVLVG